MFSQNCTIVNHNSEKALSAGLKLKKYIYRFYVYGYLNVIQF